jgi:hypothetical protein
MATISQYMSGKICEQISLALSIMDDAPNGQLKDTKIGKALLRNVGELEPLKMKVEEAIVLIRKSEKCAIGERVCRCLHKDAPLSETVFLDELAVGMVSAGKAHFVDVDAAVANVRKYHTGPIVVSKVSGKHMEICRTWAKRCVYWNMEKHKLQCIQR